MSTGGKNVPSAIDVLRSVASTRRSRSHMMNSMSENDSLQTDCLHSWDMGSGVLK